MRRRKVKRTYAVCTQSLCPWVGSGTKFQVQRQVNAHVEQGHTVQVIHEASITVPGRKRS